MQQWEKHLYQKKESSVTLEEIAFELELAGLRMEEQKMLLSSVKRSGFDAKLLDRKLIGMGYAPVFTIYDDEVVVNPHKRN
jgi:hypothetical protein